MGLVWLTNPITMLPVFYCSYKFGAWMTNTPTLCLPDESTRSWVGHMLQTHWQPLLLGSFVLGLLFAALGYLATNTYWHWWVRRSWRKRQEQRRNKPDN